MSPVFAVSYVSGTTLWSFFGAGCLRFQMQNARGSRNGSSFKAVKSREISAVLGSKNSQIVTFVGRHSLSGCPSLGQPLRLFLSCP
jgi:hypothetical protein